MENIKAYILNICVASVLTAVFGIFLPKGSIKKAADIVMSLIVLSTILVPALTVKDNNYLSSFDFFNEFYEFKEEDILENNIENQAIKSSIETQLKNNSIDVVDMEIETHKDELDYIIIDSVLITVNSEKDDDYIKNIIKTNIGIDTEIIRIVR